MIDLMAAAKILVFAGSIRTGSYNARLAALAERDARTGEYVVTSGLAEGDQVIRHPSALLKDGQAVQAQGPAKSSAVAASVTGK